MFSLQAKIRTTKGKKTEQLRKKGLLPGVLYGPKTKTANLELNYKDFERIFEEVGESSLITLEIEDEKEKPLVLIHELQKDPVTDKYTHVDFYQPILTEEIEVNIPLIFEGEALAVKDLGGTLVKNISELEVKALPQDLPHEIKVNVGNLKTFEDEVLVKDLEIPEKVKVLRELDDIVAHVAAPTKVEEELAKEIEEKVEEVEKVEKEKKEEEEVEEPKEEKPASAPAKAPSFVKTSEGKSAGKEGKEGGKKES